MNTARKVNKEMRPDIEELIEKYEDVRDSADDWVEKNLAIEVLEDLKELLRGN